MNNPKEVVAFYLRRIDNANYLVEKRIIKDDLFLYYYRLTLDECEAVRPQMQSLLNEMQLELEARDPLLRRVGDLLRHLEDRKIVVAGNS